MKNSVFLIKPYKWKNTWVFDDPAVGLVREPFIGGADTIIDVATAHITTADRGFIAVFSAGYFPDTQIVLEWVREEGGGNVIAGSRTGYSGGVLRVCGNYFPAAPGRLHLHVGFAFTLRP